MMDVKLCLVTDPQLTYDRLGNSLSHVDIIKKL